MSQGRIRFPAFPSKNPAKEAPEHKKIQSGARGRKKALSHPSRRGRRAQPLRQEQQPAVPGVRCRNLALLRATKAACKSAKTSASQSKCKAPCGFLRRVSGEVCLPPQATFLAVCSPWGLEPERSCLESANGTDFQNGLAPEGKLTEGNWGWGWGGGVDEFGQ